MTNVTKIPVFTNLIKSTSKINTNIGLVATIVIVPEVIMFYLFDTTNIYSTIIFSIGLISLPLYAVRKYFNNVKSINEDKQHNKIVYEYDIFISSPMDSFDTNKDYEEHSLVVERFVKKIKQELGLKRIYCDSIDISTKKNFESEKTSMNNMIDKITKSKYYILIMPHNNKSSICYEAGFALALEKPSAYFIKESKDRLPFVMRGSNSNINIIEYLTDEELVQKIKIEKMNIFKKGV